MHSQLRGWWEAVRWVAGAEAKPTRRVLWGWQQGPPARALDLVHHPVLKTRGDPLICPLPCSGLSLASFTSPPSKHPIS